MDPLVALVTGLTGPLSMREEAGIYVVCMQGVEVRAVPQIEGFEVSRKQDVRECPGELLLGALSREVNEGLARKS
jgi:hypothetical protein